MLPDPFLRCAEQPLFPNLVFNEDAIAAFFQLSVKWWEIQCLHPARLADMSCELHNFIKYFSTIVMLLPTLLGVVFGES